MLVLDMAVQARQRGFKNMARWDAARGNTPALPIEQQGGFRLSTSQAELSGITRQPSGTGVVAQQAKAFRNIVLGQPGDRPGFMFGCVLFSVLGNELNSPRAVFPDLPDQGEGVAIRHPEPMSPATQHRVVVGQQAPQKRVDWRMGVFGLCKR